MSVARPFARPRAAQSTVEYLLVIAVISVALAAAAYVFIEPFSQGYEKMTDDAGLVLSSGTRNGSGDKR
jgi:FlaG/FlaF family flagellin (archaellin)